MSKRILLYLFALMSVLTVGCTKEDTSKCNPGLWLNYYYTMTPEGDNRFETDVNRLAIYVFDSNKKFYKKFDITDRAQLTNGNKIWLPLPNGTYHIVSWGGTIENNYQDADMYDPSTYSFNQGTMVGETLLESFRMLTQFTTLADQSEAQIEAPNSLDPLFFGEYKQVEARDDRESSASIGMTKLTKNLNVTVSGLWDYIVPTSLGRSAQFPIDIYAIMRNGGYQDDGQIEVTPRIVRYPHEALSYVEDVVTSNINVLRLMMQDNTSIIRIKSPLFVSDANPNGVVDIPIVPTIIQNPMYNSQNDLDRHDEYYFDIRFRVDMSFDLYINGWQVIYIVPGI